VQQFDSEAIFKQNQLIVNINARLTPRFNLSGFYNWTSVKSNTGTASNSYNLMQDYRRAGFASPNMVFLMGNYTGPFNITFNPFLIAQSGRPYNFVTPNDLTGDNFFNNRPSIVASSNCTAGSTQYVQTSYGCFNLIPQPGETIIPGNMGNGPAAVAVNLRISRAFGVGPKLQSASAQNSGGAPVDLAVLVDLRWAAAVAAALVAAVAAAAALAVASVAWRHDGWQCQHGSQVLSQLQRPGPEPVQRY